MPQSPHLRNGSATPAFIVFGSSRSLPKVIAKAEHRELAALGFLQTRWPPGQIAPVLCGPSRARSSGGGTAGSEGCTGQGPRETWFLLALTRGSSPPCIRFLIREMDLSFQLCLSPGVGVPGSWEGPQKAGLELSWVELATVWLCLGQRCWVPLGRG